MIILILHIDHGRDVSMFTHTSIVNYSAIHKRRDISCQVHLQSVNYIFIGQLV